LQVNVLIDDGSNAVLCDFGLSHIKADATSRTAATDGGGIVGSRNWMAPEQLLGKSPKKPCDIFAFGMTLRGEPDCYSVENVKLEATFARFSRMRFRWVTSTMPISSS